MTEKHNGDYFELSDNVGIDLNKVVALKNHGSSLEVMTEQRGIVSTFITEAKQLNDFMYRMTNKFGLPGVNIMLSAGRYMNVK